MRSWAVRKEHLLTTVLMSAVLVFVFYATDQYMAGRFLDGVYFWNPSMPWDHRIPFAPSWVWIYLLYFPICFLPVALKEVWKDRSVFRRTAAGFAFQFAAAFAFFWIFPSQMQRPMFEADGASRQLLHWFYQIDAGFNIFPSLHVANVAYIACVFWRLKRVRLSAGIWVMCGLIAASTLFVKQHYIFDLPTGIFCGVLSFFAAFSLENGFLNARKPLPLASEKEAFAAAT